MTSARRRDTKPELELRRLLHRAGLRYRVDRTVLPGSRRRADVVFPRHKLAVFVHGCFWHGCDEHGTEAKANAEFWQQKIAANRARDRDTEERLAASGWTVITIWEHEDVVAAAERVVGTIRDAIAKTVHAPRDGTF
jgi:DNA mismatch endonuclease (patch repair protein)